MSNQEPYLPHHSPTIIYDSCLGNIELTHKLSQEWQGIFSLLQPPKSCPPTLLAVVPFILLSYELPDNVTTEDPEDIPNPILGIVLNSYYRASDTNALTTVIVEQAPLKEDSSCSIRTTGEIEQMAVRLSGFMTAHMFEIVSIYCGAADNRTVISNTDRNR